MTVGVLETYGLVRRHGGLVAVENVSVRAEPGMVTAIIGPNGAGKTTLFDCLSGVQQPDAGVVVFGDRDVTRLPPDERARRGIARTFQQSSVFRSLTVEENLLVGAENNSRQGALRGFLGLPDPDSGSAARTVSEVLGRLGLGGLRHAVAGRLSTGTLRMVELARALCTHPSCLLLDEPASGLDDEEVVALRGLLLDLARSGLSVLLIEHDVELVEEVADVVYAMAFGRVLASGPPAQVVADPEVRDLVLGLA